MYYYYCFRITRTLDNMEDEMEDDIEDKNETTPNRYGIVF